MKDIDTILSKSTNTHSNLLISQNVNCINSETPTEINFLDVCVSKKEWVAKKNNYPFYPSLKTFLFFT